MLQYCRLLKEQSGRLSGRLALTVTVALLHLPASSALAEGVAVFASLTDATHTEQTRARLVAALDVGVLSSRLDIDGTPWVRLHSAVMSEAAARDLVSRAQRSGYSAWFNGTGGSLATSSSSAATELPYVYTADDGIVTPATGDISHLPLAETYPEFDR